MESLIDFGKILLPAALVLYAMYLGVKVMIAKQLTQKEMEIKQKNMTITLPIRLQAYERMSLFLERIAANNLVLRLNQPELSAREFHQMLLAEIRNEYNHNVSQQVYMSDEVWQEIKTAKEDLITAINASAGELVEEATSLDLARNLLDYLMNKEIDPIDHALKSLKSEISKTY
jgi:hypothetical protein